MQAPSTNLILPERVLCRIENNTVAATAFKEIAAPRKKNEREEHETERGLRVADKGFMNTAVITSEITYTDGEAGSKLYTTWYRLYTDGNVLVLRYR